MIQVECSQCSRRLRVDDKAAGKSIKCPCGTSLTVPTPAATPAPNSTASASRSLPKSAAGTPPSKPVSSAASVVTSFQHRCECGRSLRVSAGDQPKKAKCPCGTVFTVPSSASLTEERSNNSLAPLAPSSSQPPSSPSLPVAVQAVPVPATNWFDDLPIPQHQHEAPYVPYSGTISPTYGVTAASSASRNVEAPSNRSLADSYLAKAEDEVYNRNSSNEDGGFWDASVMGGILMMLGAVVWFVVGLANDIIFFYPPVLFIAGLVAVVKGLM